MPCGKITAGGADYAAIDDPSNQDYDSAEGVPPNLDRATKAAALAAHYADGILLSGTGADYYAAIDNPSNQDYEAFNSRPTAPAALYSTAPTDAAGTCTTTCRTPPRA